MLRCLKANFEEVDFSCGNPTYGVWIWRKKEIGGDTTLGSVGIRTQLLDLQQHSGRASMS